MSKPAPSPAERGVGRGSTAEAPSPAESAFDLGTPCVCGHTNGGHVVNGYCLAGHGCECPGFKPEAASEFWTTVDGKMILEQEDEIAALRAEVERLTTESKMNYDNAEWLAAKLRKAHEGGRAERRITKFATERDHARERAAKLEKALREIAIRTGQWEARAIDCQEIAAAALKATP
jgi:hypothetical protein